MPQIAYYRSPYIQRGYGLGSVFASLLRFFNPAKKHIGKLLKQSSTKKILKSLGREAASTGTELLLEKAKGNKDLKSVLENRIQIAKHRISKAIKEAKKMPTKTNTKKYKSFSNMSKNEDIWSGLPSYHGKKIDEEKTRLHPKLSKRRRIRADYYKSVFE